MGNACSGGATEAVPVDPGEAERRRLERLAATEARLEQQARRGVPAGKTPEKRPPSSSSTRTGGRTKEDEIAEQWRTGS